MAPQTWFDLVKTELAKMGTIDYQVAIARLAPQLPPGYAWQRYVIDRGILKRLEADGEWEKGDPLPEPQSMDDYAKAQRHLVLHFFKQLRRSGRLREEGGTITLLP